MNNDKEPWLLFFLRKLNYGHASQWKIGSLNNNLMTISFVCGLDDTLRFKHKLYVV